jgi:DNA polymerase-3 subunit delta
MGQIYILIGEEEKLARTWLEKKLKSCIPDLWLPYNYHVFEGKKIPLEEFLSLIQSLPMASDFRVIIVKQSDELEKNKIKKITGVFQTIPETTILIFSFVPGPSDLKKISLGKEWEEVLKTAEILKFNFKKDEKLFWIRDKAKEKEVQLTREDESILLESGADLNRLEMELDKMALFSGKPNLESEKTLFDFLDGIGERKAGKALKALKDLLGKGDPPVRILGALVSQIRLLWQIKCLFDEKKSGAEISKILRVHPFRVTKGLAHLKKFKGSELPRLADWLAKADWSLKTGRQEPSYLLEIVTAKICQG